MRVDRKLTMSTREANPGEFWLDLKCESSGCEKTALFVKGKPLWTAQRNILQFAKESHWTHDEAWERVRSFLLESGMVNNTTEGTFTI